MSLAFPFAFSVGHQIGERPTDKLLLGPALDRLETGVIPASAGNAASSDCAKAWMVWIFRPPGQSSTRRTAGALAPGFDGH